MNRFLLISQVLSFGLIGMLGYQLMIATPATVEDDPTPRRRTAPSGAGHSAEASDPAARIERLERELDALRDENAALGDDLEDLELEALSMSTALDDVQSMALKNTLALDRALSAAHGTGPEQGFPRAGQEELATLSQIEAGDAQDGVTVSPTFDHAVRQVLASMNDERKQERLQRELRREDALFVRVADRYGLAEGQARVVRQAFERRRDTIRELRDSLRTGDVDKAYSQEHTRLAQEQFRAETSGFLTTDQWKDMNRFLSRRGQPDTQAPKASAKKDPKPERKRKPKKQE